MFAKDAMQNLSINVDISNILAGKHHVQIKVLMKINATFAFLLSNQIRRLVNMYYLANKSTIIYDKWS
jgi:hypothetical protein